MGKQNGNQKDQAMDPGGQLGQAIASGQAVLRIENENMQALTIKRPRRPLTEIIAGVIEEIELAPEFAAKNFYVLPFKEKKGQGDQEKTVNVEGLSIDAAMVIQRHLQNCTNATRTIGEDEENVYVQGVMLDLETNTRTMRERTVPKRQWRRAAGTAVPLKQHELSASIEANKSKAVRNAILAATPVPIKAQMFAAAKRIAAENILPRTGKKGNQVAPIGERIDAMLAHFQKNYGVEEADILKFLELEKRDQITDEMIGRMIGIANSLRDGETSVAEAFGKGGEETPSVGAETLKQMEAAEAVKEAKPAQEQPAAKSEQAKAPAAGAAFGAFCKEIARVLAGFPDAERTDKQQAFVTKLLAQEFSVGSLQELKEQPEETITAKLEKVKSIVEYLLEAKQQKQQKGAPTT